MAQSSLKICCIIQGYSEQQFRAVSSGVEHCIHTAGVTSSKLVLPTKILFGNRSRTSEVSEVLFFLSKLAKNGATISRFVVANAAQGGNDGSPNDQRVRQGWWKATRHAIGVRSTAAVCEQKGEPRDPCHVRASVARGPAKKRMVRSVVYSRSARSSTPGQIAARRCQGGIRSRAHPNDHRNPEH